MVEAATAAGAPNSGVERPATQRTGLARYFFVALGVLGIVVAVAGFGPNLYQFLRGELFIPPIVHVHAAFLMGWVVLYTVQASLVARGDLSRHRQVGWAATGLAAAVWASMGVVTIVALKRFDPDQYGFLVQPLLIQLGQMVMFPVFVTWAVLARRRASWHKRMLTYATFVLLQAALDRMHWLPHEGLPMFWHSGLRLYVLMLPLFIFDIVTLRRIHPATLIGAGLIVVMHAVVSFYWAHEGWARLARSFWISLRSQ